jgi:hypothetical protein
VVLASLLLALLGCGPESSGPAMLGADPGMLAGAPDPASAGGRRPYRPAADTPAAAAESALEPSTDRILRELTADQDEMRRRGLIQGGAPATREAPVPVVSTTTAPPPAPAATAIAPPKWNQGGTSVAARSQTGSIHEADAASRPRSLGFDVEPPSLESTAERAARAANEAAAAARIAAADRTDARPEASRRGRPDSLDRPARPDPWADDDGNAAAAADRLGARPPGSAGTATMPAPTAGRVTASPLATAEASLPPNPVAVARADLLLALLVDGIDHPDRALAHALASALTTVGDPDATIDPSLFRGVPDTERDLVEAFIEFARSATPAIAAAASDAAGAPDREALLEAIDQLRSRVARTPQLVIQRSALCTSVAGFGVFEELPRPVRFLAGRTNPFIVYLEVENFHSEQRDGGAWVTELEQRVQIYNDHDPRPVWDNEWSEVIDTNANRRRDFFTAQIIELPDTFSLGVFHLKIQVRDRLTGAESETSIEFDMVARAP